MIYVFTEYLQKWHLNENNHDSPVTKSKAQLESIPSNDNSNSLTIEIFLYLPNNTYICTNYLGT